MEKNVESSCTNEHDIQHMHSTRALVQRDGPYLV